MKKILLAFCVLLSGALFCQLFAQTDQASQKAWMDYMTPGNVHKMLAKADGEWKSETIMWMAPGAPPVNGIGTCINKMILGGRYQESRYTGNFMGMPFEGIGTLGYDNVKKIFVSSWIDNLGTGIVHMEGKWDDNTKMMTLFGKEVDPMSGRDMDVKETFKWVDDNFQIMAMYTQQDGKEFKTMEIKFTRK